MAFDVEFDPSLKNGVKNKRAYPEMLDYAQIKENITAIKAALDKEISPGTNSGNQLQLGIGAGSAGTGGTGTSPSACAAGRSSAQGASVTGDASG